MQMKTEGASEAISAERRLRELAIHLPVPPEAFGTYTEVEAYPKWQAWMRKHQPRLLVLWGKYDLSSDVLDAGHFALDTAADEIAVLVRTFMR